MKNLLISLINLYQKIPLPCHDACRFTPTCSNYAKEAIERFGVFKGMLLATKRILKCNPFGPSGFDPVPMKKEKKK